jgi:hypothetical protein
MKQLRPINLGPRHPPVYVYLTHILVLLQLFADPIHFGPVTDPDPKFSDGLAL